MFKATFRGFPLQISTQSRGTWSYQIYGPNFLIYYPITSFLKVVDLVLVAALVAAARLACFTHQFHVVAGGYVE
jgi:hypothetical protein